MLRSLLVLVSLLVAASPARAEDGLSGDWSVDLASEPGKVYTQPMQLELKDDGTVAGSFYNSAIEAGRWKFDRGRLCASFRTSDGTGPYHSAVCLVDDQAVGQTWAEHRDFLFNWNAARVADAP
ncbi:hypothetical protein [Aquimonas voraii]|uniref:Extracellular endo-alpha-(1->5)-L-arabinanase C-terminal domain-containing protein n=1 Tax=Aquimonas voraii TaxID=265719 RepID=A0A1G6UUP7_9GAMM|nr:hypothetical protein [Aquimonas voraii]SDD44436.1 hypothetical protein SAMN04488509_102478 [Aquimonas voraii]